MRTGIRMAAFAHWYPHRVDNGLWELRLRIGIRIAANALNALTALNALNELKALAALKLND